MVYFSSDFHLGHKAILKYRPQFSTIEDHDNAIFSQLEKLTKRDQLFILGDFLFDCPNFENYLVRLSKLQAKFKLIMGNHDSLKLYSQTIAQNLTLHLPLVNYKNFWLSHCPIHEQELRGRLGNIHGHLHGSHVEDQSGAINCNYFNVNLDNNNFKLVELDTIKNYFKKD